ncbi:hypothetical protein Ccrd_013022, partial [Cynara cardunculus var. scolymus]
MKQKAHVSPLISGGLDFDLVVSIGSETESNSHQRRCSWCSRRRWERNGGWGGDVKKKRHGGHGGWNSRERRCSETVMVFFAVVALRGFGFQLDVLILADSTSSVWFNFQLLNGQQQRQLLGIKY